MGVLPDETARYTDEEKLEEKLKRLEEENANLRKQFEEYESYDQIVETPSPPNQSFIKPGQSEKKRSNNCWRKCKQNWKNITLITAGVLILFLVGHIIFVYTHCHQERKETHENHQKQTQEQRTQCARDLEKQLYNQKQLFEQEKTNLIASHNNTIEQERLNCEKNLHEELAKQKTLHDQHIRELMNQYYQRSAKVVAYQTNSGAMNEKSVLAAIISSSIFCYFLKLFQSVK